MSKLKYALTLLCVLLCITAVWSTPAYATAEDSTLTVEYIHEETPIEDTNVAIYLIATWDYDTFTLTEDFETVGIDLNHLESPSEWRDEGEIVAQYIDDNGCTPVATQVTDSVGRTTFANLVPGVYYVDVADMDYEDGTLISSPVLTTLPFYTGETNTYTYHVVMEPKVAFEETPEVPSPTPTPSPTSTPRPSTPSSTPTPTPSSTPDPTPTPVPTTPSTPDDPTDPGTPETPETPDTPEDLELFEIPDPEVPLDPFLLEIFDLPVPLTGSTAWLIIPLALVGAGLILFGLFGLGKKRGQKE